MWFDPPALIVRKCGAVGAWLIYDISSAEEAPSQALAILHYVLLALLIVSFVGSVWKYLTAE